MDVPTSDTSSAAGAAGTRLKRENFRRTKHDSAFSQWKILIGASDWEDHSMGKEGAEKYRTQNLPNWTACPGVYELGIAILHPRSGRETRKFNSRSIVPVYLGQADNLRTRLQQYGRDGAHLDNGCSNIKIANFQSVSSHKGPGLFTDVFSRGLPIVYRCAPMKSKEDAEMTEKQLLDKFDYGWNKGSNGARRQDDIRKILDHLEKASQFSLFVRKLLSSNQREVGIKIRTGSNSSNKDNSTIFSRILGIMRLQPRKVQYGSSDDCNDICGVAISHGSVCTTPPVAGRKRCALHKGLRVNGYIRELNTEGKVLPIPASMGSGIILDRHCSEFQDQKLSHSRETHHPSEHATDGNFASTCGFILDDGSPCKKNPVQGNKRCLDHKGRRIYLRVNGYISKLNTEGIIPPIPASMGSGRIPDRHRSDFQDHMCHSRETHHPWKHANDGKSTPTCGFILDDGSPCKRNPVQGNKRCLEHKGRRIKKIPT